MWQKKVVSKNERIQRVLPPKQIAVYAYILKKYLDETNPKGYKVISIVTSPNAITNAMEFLGAEVIDVPISSLRLIPKKEFCADVINNYPNLEKVLNYLKNKDINDDNKNIVVIDITHKGRTLGRFANLLERYLGVDSNRIKQVNLIKTLTELREELESFDLDDSSIRNFALGELEGLTAEISATPHFNVINDERNKEKPDSIASIGKTEEELFEEFEKHSNSKANAYNLLVYKVLEDIKSKQFKQILNAIESVFL